jgi:hypothetical protein
MLNTQASSENYTSTLASGEVVRSNVPWIVTSVEARPDYRLFVKFIDGLAGEVQMRELIFSDHAGVFASLRDPDVFSDLGCGEGFVEWANGLDIAPDATHVEIQQCGLQVLR